MAEVQLQIEDVADAHTTLRGFSGVVADGALVSRVNAWLQLEQGQSSEALETLGEVPLTSAARLLVARAHQAAGNAEEARRLYSEIAGDAKFAGEAFWRKARLELTEQEYVQASEDAQASTFVVSPPSGLCGRCCRSVASPV